MIWIATGTMTTVMTTVMLAAMGWLRQGLRAEMKALGSALRSEMAAGDNVLRAEMTAEIGGLRGDIKRLDDRMARFETRLVSIETTVLSDHGQRIARLEERTASA